MSVDLPVGHSQKVTTPHAIKIGFVLHVMQVAGAEVLVAETIRRLGRAIDPVVLCLDDVGALGEDLRKSGIPVVVLGRKPGIDWPCVRRFRDEISRHSIEVLHAHQYTPFFYSALAARSTRPRPRIVFTEHGRHYPDVVSGKRRLFNRLYLARQADRITCVCEFSAKALSEKDGFDRRRIEIIENGIDPEKYTPPSGKDALRRQLGLDPARRYVACVARFHPVKDHKMLLSAFAVVADRVSDVDLLLAGDGPLRRDLEQQAASLGIAGRTRFLGVRGDVPQILAASDVFALTSVSEAASITLLEAMASELPAVVTNVGGNPELVRQGIDGHLVPRGDSAAMAAALIETLGDRARAREMGRQAAARVHERFALSRTIARYDGLYRGLMTG